MIGVAAVVVVVVVVRVVVVGGGAKGVGCAWRLLLCIVGRCRSTQSGVLAHISTGCRPSAAARALCVARTRPSRLSIDPAPCAASPINRCACPCDAASSARHAQTRRGTGAVAPPRGLPRVVSSEHGQVVGDHPQLVPFVLPGRSDAPASGARQGACVWVCVCVCVSTHHRPLCARKWRCAGGG